MTDFPSENTLTANGTHQQLIDLGGDFARGTVVSPTRVEEKEKGYDVKHEWAKQIVYQYKRPVNLVSDREVEKRDKIDCFAFPFEGEQARTLIVRNPVRRVAFHVLPLVDSGKKLSEVLQNTLFIDVHGLLDTARTAGIELEQFSRFYASLESKRVYLKHSKTDWRTPAAYHSVPSRYVYRWEKIKELIERCHLGLRIRWRGRSGIEREFQLKQRLDTALNEFTASERGVEVVENIKGIARRLQSAHAEREHRYEDEPNERIDIEGWEVELSKALDAATEPEDLVSEDAVGCMCEFGEETDDSISVGV